MTNWAIIKDNKIINRIVADSKEIAEQVTGLEVIDDEDWIQIGFEKFNDSWRAPYPTDGLEYTWDDIAHFWVPVNPIFIEE